MNPLWVYHVVQDYVPCPQAGTRPTWHLIEAQHVFVILPLIPPAFKRGHVYSREASIWGNTVCSPMLDCIIFVEGEMVFCSGEHCSCNWIIHVIVSLWNVAHYCLAKSCPCCICNGGLYTLWFQIAASEESLTSCEEQCAAQGIQFFVFNPLLSQPLTLSVDVSLKDTVESVVQTIGQVSGKPLDNLITFLNN